MANSPKFVSFFEALRLVAESLGSEALAWEDLPKALKDGKIRALADIQHLHELRGNVIREVKDHVLSKEYWSDGARFSRWRSNSISDALGSGWNFDPDGYTTALNGWNSPGFETPDFPTRIHSNIRLYLPELIAVFPGVQAQATQDAPPAPAQPPAKEERSLKTKTIISYDSEDEPLLIEMHRLINAKAARSIHAAALSVVDKAHGSTEAASRVRRLCNKYKTRYGSA